jgi:hypothetical protein
MEQLVFEEIARASNISITTIRRDISIEQWGLGTIDIQNPDKIDLATYALSALIDLRTNSLEGSDFLQSYTEDFSQWTEQNFDSLSRAYRRELIAVLKRKGIQAINTAATQAKQLYDIAKGECTVPGIAQTQLRTEQFAQSSAMHDKGKGPQLTPLTSTEHHVRSGETIQDPPGLYAPTPRLSHTHGNQNLYPPLNYKDDDEHHVRRPSIPRATTQVPHEIRTNELPQRFTARQPTPTPSYYYGQHLSQQPQPRVYNQTTIPYNPYELPPTQEYTNNRLPPDKIVQFQKSWRKDNNYTGKPYDILTDKTKIFIELCQRLDIHESQYSSIFPDILEGRASTYYIHSIGPGLTWKQLYDKMNNHFNTNVNHNQYWTDWTTMSFARCKQDNLDKSLHEILEIMIDKLSLAQRALGPDFQGEVPLHTAVVRACRGQPELEQAMFSIKPTCEALFSDLRSAIQITIDRQAHQYQQEDVSSYYTDRRYNSAPRTKYKGDNYKARKPTTYNRPRLQGDARKSLSQRYTGQTKKICFICRREGCWSSNHPRTERAQSRRQYISAYEELHNDTPSHQAVAAYITGIEGLSESDHEDNTVQEQSDYSEDDQEQGEQAVHFLTSTAYLHRTTGEDIYSMDMECQADQFMLDGRYCTTYQGELWDTGAATVSTVGKAQLEAYIRDNPRTKVDWTPGKTSISFGGQGPKGSLGTVRIKNQVGAVTYHILDTPTPFLFCLADADRLGAYFNNVLNVIVRKDDTTIPVVRKWGHPFFNVRKQEVASFFTETELRRLHRRFGHPRTERLYKMLTEAGHTVNPTILEQIQKFCHFCQTYGSAPQRFKFSIKDDKHFNYEIIIDVVRIGNKDALHVIDADTSFQAAVFLKSMSARDTWEALCKCWINTYQGPPDYIVHDPGTNFAADEFQTRAKIVGAQCRQMPVEAHWAVGKIERAHAPLRRTFNILRAELDDRTDDEAILQMAIKALNDTAGPDGLVPTLLVFGAYPRINTESPPSPDIIARANAVRKAMRMLRNEQAKASIGRAIHTRNGPNAHDVLKLPLKSEIMVWREKGGWMGPYELKAIQNQDVVVELENGPVTFRCTQAKPYYRVVQPHEKPNEADPDEPPPVQTEAQKPRRRGRPRKDTKEQEDKDKDYPNQVSAREEPTQQKKRGRPRKVVQKAAQTFLTQKEKSDYELAIQLRTEGIISTPGAPFEESDRTEMEALIANGTFEVLRFDARKDYGRIFNLRLVREVKGKTTQPYEKSRLVFAGHSDTGKEEILTQSPTIQRMSQRLLLAIGASLIKTYGMHCELRDITQAYVQSKDKLLRTLHARPPKELQHSFPPNTILRVVRPLYGAAESGLYWFKTYHNHHKEKLRMKTSTYDPCLLVTDEGKTTFGITGLQTDDTISVVTLAFAQREQEELDKANFRAKPKTILTQKQPVEFNGGRIEIVQDNIKLTQKGQSQHLRTINPLAADAAQQYIAQRARGAYIASVCQPEAVFDLSKAAQTTSPTDEDISTLNARLKWQIENPARGLTFVPLDIERTKLFIFTDGSFANNKDLSSQLGFVIVLATEQRTRDGHDFTIYGNIVHWNSIKCKRVTRSVLASELYGMVNGFDSAIAVSTTLQQVVRTLDLPQIPVIVCSDSKSLYDCLVKLGTTNEKRLMIDIMSLRESYENREITEVRWINGKDNPADACTKHTPNSALEKLVSTNTLKIRVEAFVDRLEPVRGATRTDKN